MWEFFEVWVTVANLSQRGFSFVANCICILSVLIYFKFTCVLKVVWIQTTDLHEGWLMFWILRGNVFCLVLFPPLLSVPSKFSSYTLQGGLDTQKKCSAFIIRVLLFGIRFLSKSPIGFPSLVDFLFYFLSLLLPTTLKVEV